MFIFKKYKNLLLRSYKVLKKLKIENKKKSVLKLTLLSFLSYLLELISLGSIIPLIFLILKKDQMMEYVNDIDYLSEFSYSEILVISISAILFFSVLKFFILVYFNYYKNFFFAKVQTSSSSYLLEKYLNNSYFFYLKKNVSELIANIKAEAERFRGFLSILIDLMFELFVISSILIFLLYVNFIASVVFAFFIIFSSYLFLKIVKKYTKRIGEKKSYFYKVVNNHLFLIFKNIKFIKIFNLYDYSIKTFKEIDTKELKQTAKYLTVSSIPKIYFDFIFILSTIILICLLFFFFKEDDTLVIGQYLSIYGLMAFRVLPSISRIYSYIQQINFYGNSVTIFSNNIFSNTFRENKNNFLFKKLSQNILYEFSKVQFKYNKKDKSIIENTSFKINFGDKIVITGPSGVGKSTIVDLILGVLEPTEGKIFINKNFAKNFNTLKNKLGYVSQDLKLIDGSIKENITFGSDIKNLSKREMDERLNKCAATTNSHSFINKLKRKFNTKIYEDGKNLSAGQRQRILIARSIFNNPKLLVMDEPTSALDLNNSNKIIKNIVKFNKSMTLIVVTHHKTILKNFNKFLNINNSKILIKGK
ncbi:MAG: hypothetical protein CBC82_07465 [Cellvibrionales bacterium TMED122]|nr:MAG: hypothetical protein CBC82_07465 [Cellvibrionales bacterium TMED122]